MNKWTKANKIIKNMAKKFISIKCVHCLSYCDNLTSDHVFPKSWYPTSTPANLEKWQVPSCKKCNSKYGKIEADLLLRFGLALNPVHHSSKGIVDKALRAIDPNSAKGEKDRIHRLNKRKKIMKELLSSDQIDYRSVLPNRGTPQNINKPIGILLPAESLKNMGKKFVRGITYVLEQRYIDKQHEIDIFFVHEENAIALMELIRKFGKTYARGAGIIIKRATIPEDPQAGVYAIDMWEQIYMYATIMQKR